MNEEKWAIWQQESSTTAKVALDAGMEGRSAHPGHPGYGWARASVGKHAVPPSIGAVFPEVWEALAAAQGDLTQVEPTLIPDGGVVCPPGSFVMGSPESEPGRYGKETQHRVTLTRSFALGKYPVTQRLYTAVVGKNPSMFSEGDEALRRPVEKVSWYDAVRFCNRLSKMLGLEAVYTITGRGYQLTITVDGTRNGFRLPTEAEWEYAARSGGDSFVYAGSDDLKEVGWYMGNSGKSTHAVGQKKPNRWGLYDMSGNVWEWVQDGAADYPGDTVDYVNISSSSNRVYRGGGWYSIPGIVRVAYREDSNPIFQSSFLGLRLARTVS